MQGMFSKEEQFLNKIKKINKPFLLLIIKQKDPFL